MSIFQFSKIDFQKKIVKNMKKVVVTIMLSFPIFCKIVVMTTFLL
jgi:hypothetical protein